MAEIEAAVRDMLKEPTLQEKMDQLREQSEMRNLRAKVLKNQENHLQLATLFKRRYKTLHPDEGHVRLQFDHGETVIYEEWFNFDDQNGVVYSRKWINSYNEDEPVMTYRLTLDELFAELK